MISEGSCDTENWSNDAENSALISGINYIIKYIQIENGYFKGVIWCDFKFSFLFGVLQAVCAYIRSVKLQRLKSQTQRDILYKS